MRRTSPQAFRRPPALALLLLLLLLGDQPPSASGAEREASGGTSSPVIGLSFRGLHRAYPLDTFTVPRVINDRIRQQEIVVYHDPGRDLSAAYIRLVLGESIEFSESLNGTLAEDITTVTRWDMTSGKAVAGNLLGMELVPLPVTRTSMPEWLASHPDTTVYAAEGP